MSKRKNQVYAIIVNLCVEGTNMKYVVSAFLFKDDKVLLIKHKKSGLWLPVGGHIENDEGFLDALNREISEEISATNCDFVFPNKTYEDTAERKREPLPFYCQMKTTNNVPELILEFAGKITSSELKIQEEEILDYDFFSLDAIDDSDDIIPIVKKKVILAKKSYDDYFTD